MKPDWITWSNAVWAAWIFIVFLSLELAGWAHIAPWRTLSETVWVDEKDYPILYLIVGGFLSGLTLHLLSRVPLLTSVLIGLTVAVLSHILDGYPKW